MSTMHVGGDRRLRRGPESSAERSRRMQWWREARFGLFVHWGLYSQLGRHEWAMNRECIPVAEYEQLAGTWTPGPFPAREWARLARDAGARYMVMTAKHHEGFCLWDSALTDYNAAKCGPGRDLVAEYVHACREFGIKVGLYYSLMDWRHPDGTRCALNAVARRRFVDFTHGCVRELMTRYGRIDILWYDVPWPLDAERWETRRMNAMVRELQPHILLNDRGRTPGDFSTSEEEVRSAEEGRDWEACMTFNGAWGWQPAPPEDWRSPRSVLCALRQVAAGGGNLLLNIGPRADGVVPGEAVERLETVGRWIRAHGEAVYGEVDRVDDRLEWMPTGQWTLKGKTAYFWCTRWPGTELVLGGFRSRLKHASLLSNGEPVSFRQERDRLMLTGLPAHCPDPVAGIAVLKLEFASRPRQVLGPGCSVLASPRRMLGDGCVFL